MMYFSYISANLSQTFRLYVSIHAIYPANFNDMVQQMQQFKL